MHPSAKKVREGERNMARQVRKAKKKVPRQVGGPMDVLVQFADALNESIRLHGQAIALTSGLGARF
jgi:hypothetical protein